VEVLHGVDFEVLPGEVHVLAGENGAGKSTLVNVLSGVYTDFSGDLVLEGKPRRFSRPSEATGAGIATIHQELSLVPSMTVADNLFLGRELVGRWGRVDFDRQEAEARRLLEEAELDVSPRQLVVELPVSVQQMLEITRALAREALVLVLDEPTSALAEREADTLFARIREMKARGCGVVYITHRMEEIYRLADRITVLRDGDRMATAPAAALGPDELVTLMVGRALARPAGRRARTRTAAGAAGDESADLRTDSRREASAAALSVNDLRVAHPLPELARAGRAVVDGVSFDVAEGEVVGLAGLQGSGVSDVLHALFGALGRRASLAARVRGVPYTPRDPRDALAHGVALLTSDRKALGLAPELSVAHSVSLSSLDRFTGRLGWMREGEERAAVRELTDGFHLATPSLDAPVRALSGGNQQKVYLARCLMAKPQLLLLDEPTRGIDVGAKADIYALVRGWTERGITILLITSEMDELLLLADRILVMHRGRVTAELDGSSATKDMVLAAAMGGYNADSKAAGAVHTASHRGAGDSAVTEDGAR
jgi:ribose transport system ATP-binding protein